MDFLFLGRKLQFMSSLNILDSFVLYQNAELRRQHGSSHGLAPRVKVGCGHLTYNADAECMIHEVRSIFERIIAGNVPVTSSGEKRGVIHDFWLESENSRYSVMAPRRVFEEARKYFHKIGKPEKNRIITFEKSFHGRRFKKRIVGSLGKTARC